MQYMHTNYLEAEDGLNIGMGKAGDNCCGVAVTANTLIVVIVTGPPPTVIPQIQAVYNAIKQAGQ